MSPQEGIPLFYMQELANISSKLKFDDRFGGDSVSWHWNIWLGEIETGSLIVVQDGKLEISIAETNNGNWKSGHNEAPRIYINMLSQPCIIKTKMTYFSNPLGDGFAGLFIGKQSIGDPDVDYFFFGRGVDDQGSAGEDSIRVSQQCGAIQAQVVGLTTLPIWLRIRLSCFDEKAVLAYYDYSLDNLNWTNLFEHKGDPAVTLGRQDGGQTVGLVCGNGTYLSGTYHGCHAKFDRFTIISSAPNQP
ncbi:hypothetical protein ES702_07693 [subsurface metagenome]